MIIPPRLLPLPSGIFCLIPSIYMICCSKCMVDKPEDEYQVYWHSNFNRHYRRKVCTECFNEQKKQHRKIMKEKKQLEDNPDLYYTNHPELDYHKCNKCLVWKQKNDYYHGKNTSTKKLYRAKICKECIKKREQDQALEELIEKGGSDRIMNTPGKFVDIYQKTQTFDFLKLIGWTYNEELNVWFKSGYKELINGKIVFPNIKKKRNAAEPVSIEEFDEIVRLHKEGVRNSDIARIVKRSQPTICQKIKQYYVESNKNKENTSR